MSTRDLKDAVDKLRIATQESIIEFKVKYPTLSEPFVTCVYRSSTEQQALYNQGRTTPGPIVTHAKPGQSKHNTLPSKAVDIAFKTKEGKLDWDTTLFDKFAVIMKAKGISWGGDFRSFKDKPHFEI